MICMGMLVRVGIGKRERNLRGVIRDINGFYNILFFKFSGLIWRLKVFSLFKIFFYVIEIF